MRHGYVSHNVAETQRVSKPNPVEGSLYTVDGSNPAPFDMVNYAIIYRVLYIPGGDRWISEPSNRIILLNLPSRII